MPDTFTYQQFRVGDDKFTVSFDYSLTHDGQTYNLTEVLKFPVTLLDSDAQRASLRALHVALGVSYYKTFCQPTITQPYQMDDTEAEFWNGVWRNGLGEFLYVNKLSPDTLAKFGAQDGSTFATETSSTTNNTALLGIGGGKDSIVAGESLKKIGVDLRGFVMATGEQLGQAKAVADTMGIQLDVVERALDKQLLELQELPGAHKGHVPISLIFGLVGTALAVATNARYVVVANEASASIPRAKWEHGSVNHQWSKSFEFEQQLQAYAHEHISPNVTYFSAVRELTSIGIAKLFAQYSQYFDVFTSDNSVFRIDPSKRPNARWSLESPKSLSSFILLAPWLSEDDLLGAFGRNFLDEQSLEQLFWELTGVEGEPPLDCVGTTEELVLSLNLAAQQGKFMKSYLMRQAQKRNLITEDNPQDDLRPMLDLQPEQALPTELVEPINNLFTRELTA